MASSFASEDLSIQFEFIKYQLVCRYVEELSYLSDQID